MRPSRGSAPLVGLWFIMALAGGAHAEGIAFSLAPEWALAACRAADTAEAIACSRARCLEAVRESGFYDPPDDLCEPIAWCAGGWAVAVSLYHEAGVHWSEVFCGWETRGQAAAAGAVRCEVDRAEEITDCIPTAVWDPEGNRRSLIE